MVDRQATRPLGKVDPASLLDGRLEFKAMHDALTGLPNRYLLQDRLRHALAHARRYNTQPALIFMEIEELAAINDAVGDKSGREALKDICRRLAKCKRESDTLARYGFDKFALLLENVSREQELETIIQRIAAALSDPIEVKGEKFIVSPKIGSCLCGSECCAFETPEKADIAKCYGSVMANAIGYNERILV